MNRTGEFAMPAYDQRPTITCADGHTFTDAAAHYRDMTHFWDDVPSGLRRQALTFERLVGDVPDYPEETASPAPDTTALRALIRRARAAGWYDNKTVLGVDAFHQHVWRRGLAEISWDGGEIELRAHYRLTAAVTISRTWSDDFDLTVLARVAEALGLLPPEDSPDR